MLDEEPDHDEALELLLPLLRESGDTAALGARLKAAAECSAEPMKRADYLFELAQNSVALGESIAGQRAPLNEALAANPFHEKAARLLVDVLRESEDARALGDALERLASITSDPREKVATLLEYATLLETQNRPQQAEEGVRQAIASDPSIRAWIRLCDALEARGELEEVREVLSDLVTNKDVEGAQRAVAHRRLADNCPSRWRQPGRG